MSSKLAYLQKYMSSDEKGSKEKKRRKKIKKRSNVVIHDDDVDWKTLAPKDEPVLEVLEEDPENAPVVAEFEDDTVVEVVKWKPAMFAEDDQLNSEPQDSSPPRRTRRHDSPDLSPRRGAGRLRKQSSEDLSPPRQKRSAPDLSPPRRDPARSPDLSPPRRGRRISPDLSPPRRGPARSPDLSPLRRGRRISPDLSPPRRGPARSPDLSPPRRGRRMSPDLSPPRRGPGRAQAADLSPPRRAPRRPAASRGRRQRHDSPESVIITPAQRPRHDSDLSPPRRAQPASSPPHRKKARHVSDDLSPPRQSANSRTLSGNKVGLQSADALREEIVESRKERERFFRELDPEVSGKNSETVYRKDGKRIDPKLERLRKRKEEMKKMEEDEQFMQWGRGVAQVKSAQEKLEDDLYEMTKPLARLRDDADLERMLKEKEREGDPMLAFIRKSKKTKQQAAGKIKREKPTYKGQFPENRFGLRPGYRWDGIDRSNGFERALFVRSAEKTAIKEVMYKWSTEEM